MYVPAEFEVKESDEIKAFIRANAFGQLFSTVNGRPFSSWLPFELNESGDTLTCHFARNNPQWKEIEGQELLVTLLGAHDYISPSWYSLPGVPTWNFQAAHIYGKGRLVDDAEGIKKIVNSLTAKFEANQAMPWQPDYHEGMVKAIIGLEISISEVQCKYKLSQNKVEEDQRRVIHALEKSGSTELSAAMQAHLFKPD